MRPSDCGFKFLILLAITSTKYSSKINIDLKRDERFLVSFCWMRAFKNQRSREMLSVNLFLMAVGSISKI